MREILFRGKRLDNGEWVEGSLLKVTLNGDTFYLIFGDNFRFFGDDVEALSHAIVDPSTVGQYTGLNDKNGKKIFEGDIVKADNGEQSSISVVKFGEYYPEMFYYMLDMFMLGVPHLNANGFYAVSTKHEDMILFKSRYFEVIGNVHDNLELIKEEGET